MNKAAEDAGLEIKKGQLETFPNTKRYNSLFNGHRLPLQQGSYLLDKDYVPESDRVMLPKNYLVLASAMPPLISSMVYAPTPRPICWARRPIALIPR